MYEELIYTVNGNTFIHLYVSTETQPLGYWFARMRAIYKDNFDIK